MQLHFLTQAIPLINLLAVNVAVRNNRDIFYKYKVDVENFWTMVKIKNRKQCPNIQQLTFYMYDYTHSTEYMLDFTNV